MPGALLFVSALSEGRGSRIYDQQRSKEGLCGTIRTIYCSHTQQHMVLMHSDHSNKNTPNDRCSYILAGLDCDLYLLLRLCNSPSLRTCCGPRRVYYFLTIFSSCFLYLVSQQVFDRLSTPSPPSQGARQPLPQLLQVGERSTKRED